ncbi:hypothetical protein GCM10023085_43700 [Actinomadura viridis]
MTNPAETEAMRPIRPIQPIRTITANGLEFGYLSAGPADGPLALCLHGFPDSAYSWRHLLPELAAAGYHAVAPFMRGYAPTAVPADGAYQSGALAADANALHEALGGAADAVLIPAPGAAPRGQRPDPGLDHPPLSRWRLTPLFSCHSPAPAACRPGSWFVDGRSVLAARSPPAGARTRSVNGRAVDARRRGPGRYARPARPRRRSSAGHICPRTGPGPARLRPGPCPR